MRSEFDKQYRADYLWELVLENEGNLPVQAQFEFNVSQEELGKLATRWNEYVVQQEDWEHGVANAEAYEYLTI